MAKLLPVCLSSIGLLSLFACSPAEEGAILQTTLASPMLPTGWHQSSFPFSDDYVIAVGEQTVFVGASLREVQDSEDGELPDSGAVIPFERTEDGWDEQPPISSDEPSELGYFGTAVATSEGLLAVGAAFPGVDATLPGSVSIYGTADSAWTRAQPALQASSGDPGFGRSLAMTPELLVIGSAKLVEGEYFGAAYVSAYGSGRWQAPVELSSANAQLFEYGAVVAAADDTVAVAAETEGESGSVYLFESSDWGSAKKHLRGHEYGAMAGARFGAALALTDKYLLIGAPNDGQGGRGAAYLFERATDGSWDDPPTTLISKDGSTSDGAANESFGYSVGLTFGLAFIGAPNGESGTPRVHGFALLPPYDEEVRLRSDDPDLGLFGARIATGPSMLVIGAKERVYGVVLDLGATCRAGSDCNSGHCVEGICCDTPCDGACSSCLAAIKQSGEDGTCGHVPEGTNPKAGCFASGRPCDTTGLCDGSGECAFVRPGTPCGTATCTNDREALIGRGRCDGAGECLPPEPVSCRSEYLCFDGACATSCDSTSEGASSCAPGHWCYQGACVAGPRCSVDRLVAYDERGKASVCADYYCRDGACPLACSRTLDCIVGVCHPSGVCQQPESREATAPLRMDGDSGCAVGIARGARSAWIFSSFLAVALAILRRRSACPFNRRCVPTVRQGS